VLRYPPDRRTGVVYRVSNVQTVTRRPAGARISESSETGYGNHVTENMRHTMENFISYI
jgi:hypothetical protein